MIRFMLHSILGRNMTETLLCSSHCLLAGDVQFQFVPILNIITLITWLKWCLRGFFAVSELQHPALGFHYHPQPPCTNSFSLTSCDKPLLPLCLFSPNACALLPSLWVPLTPPSGSGLPMQLPTWVSSNGYWKNYKGRRKEKKGKRKGSIDRERKKIRKEGQRITFNLNQRHREKYWNQLFSSGKKAQSDASWNNVEHIVLSHCTLQKWLPLPKTPPTKTTAKSIAIWT